MMMHYIIKEGLVDQDFVDRRTEGWEEFRDQLLALDVDKMEQVTGVDRELVRQAAIAYAKSPRRHELPRAGRHRALAGTFTVMQIADLAMMTGNIGRRGVGVNPLRGQNNVQGAADMGAPQPRAPATWT